MYKQLAGREIEFSDRSQDKVSGADVTIKGDKSAVLARSQYSSGSKPIALVVSEIIARKAEWREEASDNIGVWNPIGKQFACNGQPDTDLASLEPNNRRRRKPSTTKEYADSSRRMIKLQDDIRRTQRLLKNWQIGERKKPKVAADTRPQKSDKKDSSERVKSTAPRKLTTIEVIQALDSEAKPKKKPPKPRKQRYDFRNETDPDTLVARWHEKFVKAKIRKDEELLDRLVTRAEDKAAVFASKVLRSKAATVVESEGKEVWLRSRKSSTRRRKSSAAIDQSADRKGPRHSSIKVGNLCMYASPTMSAEEEVEVMEVIEVPGRDEFQYKVLPEHGGPFKAWERYLTKVYKRTERKRQPGRKPELTLWERSKLIKLRDMEIQAPTAHFANRVRNADLRRSQVGKVKAGDEAEGAMSPGMNSVSPMRARNSPLRT